MKKCTLLLVVLFIGLRAYAQVDSLERSISINNVEVEYAVTEKLEQVSVKIDEETIRRHPAKQLSELLNQVPGFHIQEALGNAGSPQQYSVRGGRSKDVLIVVNGIPLNDVSQINPFQDLNLIPVETVQSIEVIYGGASVLYGASASAAVISITTKGLQQANPIQAMLELGKWNSIKQSFQVGGKNKVGQLRYTLNSSHFITDGFGAAVDRMGNGNFDDDASKRHQFSGEVGYTKHKFKLSWLNNYVHHRFDFDGGAFLDSRDSQTNNEFRSQLRLELEQGQRGYLTVLLGYQNNEREQRNNFSPSFDRVASRFEAKTFSVDAFERFALNSTIDVVAGLYGANASTNQFGVDFFTNSFGQSIDADSASFTLVDPYVYLTARPIKKVNISAGSRLNTHSDYGSHFVYQGRLNYDLVTKARFGFGVFGSYTTAFITPSLFQLYSSFGNQELEPEETATASGGFQFLFDNKVQLNANLFRRNEESLIGFSNTTFAYANTEEQTYAQGLEASLRFTPTPELVADAFYSKVDRENDVELYRIPTSEWGGSASLSPKEVPNFTLTADYRRVGERTMPLFNPTTFLTDEFELEGYNALNFTASATFWDNQINTYITARNVTEDDYIDNLGYNAEGFNVRIGGTFTMR